MSHFGWCKEGESCCAESLRQKDCHKLFIRLSHLNAALAQKESPATISTLLKCLCNQSKTIDGFLTGFIFIFLIYQ